MAHSRPAGAPGPGRPSGLSRRAPPPAPAVPHARSRRAPRLRPCAQRSGLRLRPQRAAGRRGGSNRVRVRSRAFAISTLVPGIVAAGAALAHPRDSRPGARGGRPHRRIRARRAIGRADPPLAGARPERERQHRPAGSPDYRFKPRRAGTGGPRAGRRRGGQARRPPHPHERPQARLDFEYVTSQPRLGRPSYSGSSPSPSRPASAPTRPRGSSATSR